MAEPMTAERLEEIKVKISAWKKITNNWNDVVKHNVMEELIKEIETQWMKKD